MIGAIVYPSLSTGKELVVSTVARPQSAQAAKARPSQDALRKKKKQGERLVTLTCYDYTTARILDELGLDMLLVGDSLAMTVLGYSDTLSVTVDEMLHHTKAVVRGARQTMVVADMPFMSYQVDHVEAVKNAGRFIQEGGAHGVKLEGATERVINIIQHVVEIGIPVIGHLGFTPQSIHTLGGFRVQGKTLDTARRLFSDAIKLQNAGVSALVLEMVPVEVAALISRKLDIPTIGIGAGNGCDGQILVIDDILGRYGELSPRFVRTYMPSRDLVTHAITEYAEDIRTGRFPDNDAEAFRFPESALGELQAVFEEFA